MWIATIDDTGVSFPNLVELARFFGCAPSTINWYIKHTKKRNHFYYRDVGITLKKHGINVQKRKESSKEYYRTHKEHCKALCKAWSQANKDKVKAYKKKWNSANRAYYNEYYKEQRRKRKANETL